MLKKLLTKRFNLDTVIESERIVMSNSWETTGEDIETVLIRFGSEVANEASTDDIEQILMHLNFDKIEAAALLGDSMDDQTTSAFDEIERQIREDKLLELVGLVDEG